MNAGDMVYYLYTDKYAREIRIPALVISIEEEGIHVRVGRFDILSNKLETFESTVPADKISRRLVPCSFESELNGKPSATD